jgi:DNA-binding NarL/FixJ family response regulator
VVSAQPTEAVDDPRLTERECEVLDLVALGKTNKEIANDLRVAENTVRAHLRNILDKLHVHNRTQAAAFARRG